MIVKYVNNNNSLARVDQIDVIRVTRRPRRSNASKLFWILAVSVAFAILLISFSSDTVVAVSETDTGEKEESASDLKILNMTQDSGRVLLERKIATAAGAARILEDTAQGKLLGRRGALTDARRNLLILRQKLLKDPKFSGKNAKIYSVSGSIAGVVIHSERIKGNIYFLQVDIPLGKLLEGEIEIEIE